MDRRRRGKQPRRTVGRTVRRLWLAAAAALVITYAVLLRRATVSTEQPAALRAGVASSTTTGPPLILEDETEDETEEQGGKALRIVGNELPAGLLNVVSEKEGGGIKTRVNEDVEEGGGTTAAPTTTAVQTAEEPDDEEPSAEETEAVPGEDALQPLHEFTDTDALPVKGEAGDRSVEEDHLFSDASLFDGLMAGSEKKEAGEEEEEEEADSAHGFTDASYFDQLAREADAPEEDEAMSAHLFTDASYFDGMAGAEPTEETVSQPAESTHQFSDASSFDNLGMASVEEPEEVPPAKFSRFDDSRLVQYVEPPSQAVPMEQRHDVIAGYDAAIEYLQNYSTPEGSGEQLFLFFVCSDANGTALDWKPVCADAKKAVYDVFAKSPSTNRLVTIYAGPEEA